MVNVDSVDWEDPALKRWLGTIMKHGTRYCYKTAFRAYAQYTKLSASALIDEAIEDSRRDPRQKRDVLLSRLLGFYTWLKTEYPRKSRGSGEHRILGKGVSDKLAHMFVSAVRSFYSVYDLEVRMKGARRLPKAKITNKRMIVAAEQVKILVDNARTPRDRAIILSHFQGGLDVSTLCSLTYGDVSEGLAKNEHPLKLEPQRPKTGVQNYTFLGRDAITALKAYLSDMRSKGVVFKHTTPLFLQERGKGAMKTSNVQDMMKDVAVRSGFIDAENNGKAFNPIGPHGLRESFGSIMTNSGVPDTVVDFWLFHEVGELAEAYKSVQFESLRKMYLDREKLLSISASKVDVEEIREKLRVEVEQQNRQLQIMVNSLVSENMDLKKRIQGAEEELKNIDGILTELSSKFEKYLAKQ